MKFARIFGLTKRSEPLDEKSEQFLRDIRNNFDFAQIRRSQTFFREKRGIELILRAKSQGISIDFVDFDKITLE